MPLTWRNVDAPDFRPAMEGYQQFSQLLNQGLGGLKSGLNEYDNDITKRVNTALQLQLAGLADADAAKAFNANLATDPNARRINAATIDLAMARPVSLLDQASKQENLDQTIWNNDRVQRFAGAEDEAAKLAPGYYLAAKEGKENEFFEKNPGFGAGLSLAAKKELITGAVDLRGNVIRNAGGEIQNAGGIIGNKVAEFGYTNSVTDRQEDRDARGFAEQFRSSGLTGEDLDGELANSKLSPVARALARQYLGVGGAVGSDGGFSGGGGGITGTGGADPTTLMNYEARAAGFAAVPASVKTLGQASDFALQVNRAGVKSSAMGTYQIVGDTLRRYAPKVFGANWQNMTFDAASQDKIAEAIFNDNKSPEALRKQWVSLSPADAKRAASLPWDQARSIITRGESGVENPAGLLSAQTAATVGNKNLYQQGNANSIAVPIMQAMGSSPPMREVVIGLTNDAAFKGTNPAWVEAQIEKIQASSGGGQNGAPLSPAAAAIILKQSIRANSKSRGNFFYLSDEFNPDAIGNNLEVNTKVRDSLVAEYKSGAFAKQAVANAQTEQADSQVGSARAAADQAYAEYRRIAMKAQTNPAMDPRVLQRAADRSRAATAIANATIGGVGQRAADAGALGPPSTPAPRATPNPGQRRPAVTAPPNLIDSGGSDILARARTVKAATGAQRINLEDQFQRTYGMTPGRAIFQHYATIVQEARGTTRLGSSLAGKQYQAEFTQKYGMTPAQAIAKFGSQVDSALKR